MTDQPTDAARPPRRTYVVVGATGKTGREVERHLIGQGHDVRAVARSRGVGIDDTDALDRAFADADGAFVVVPFDLASADLHAREETIADRLERAIRRSGVPRVVLLSGLNAHLRRGTSLGAALMEERLRACSVPEPIVLRVGWFMENFTGGLGFRAQAENTGVFRTPFTAHRPMPTVAARDVGRRAAELLMERMPPSFADAVVETARSFNDAQPWALAPRDDETTTPTSLRDWAHSTLAGVPA